MDERLFRQRARENLANNWGLSIGVAAVAALLGGLLVGSSFIPELSYTQSLNYSQAHEVSENVRDSFTNGILGFAAFLLGGVLQLGYAKFLLKQHDGQPIEFNDLFSQFDRFGAGFAQYFLRSLYTFFWTLLFIIPGIIASYRYRMTPFIMVEHPELSASEAIERSKKMMDGHKGELFCLDLGFIGWILLSILTLNLGHLALNPYRNAAEAAFYRELSAQQRYTVE